MIVFAQTETYTIKRTAFSTEKFDEFSPVYYKNGIVFSTNNNSGKLVDYSSSQGSGVVNIHFADTTSGTQRSVLFSKSLRTKANDGPVTFNSRSDTIYYSRNMRSEGNTREISSVRNRLGIFYAVNEGKNWTRIRELRFNNEWYNISTPWLSPDGKRLYFASDMPGGYGGTDLYYCQNRGDYWDEPVNLGSTVNTKGNEAYPFITPADEILFASDGHPGLGGKDIFYSRPVGDGWLLPVRLDPPINSTYDDFGIITDSLMSEGYFSSNRLKTADIYQFKTRFPQIFYATIQRENQYCFMFRDTGAIRVDTTNLRY
ncbi:MAG: PD40 domain-containing protein, partial [Bacteroidales bacterium]|nr:PD40 domain-containing protein [Bacteroidales bacterium]